MTNDPRTIRVTCDSDEYDGYDFRVIDPSTGDCLAGSPSCTARIGRELGLRRNVPEGEVAAEAARLIALGHEVQFAR